jgi:hypothetical protein
VQPAPDAEQPDADGVDDDEFDTVATGFPASDEQPGSTRVIRITADEAIHPTTWGGRLKSRGPRCRERCSHPAG